MIVQAYQEASTKCCHLPVAGCPITPPNAGLNGTAELVLVVGGIELAVEN